MEPALQADESLGQQATVNTLVHSSTLQNFTVAGVASAPASAAAISSAGSIDEELDSIPESIASPDLDDAVYETDPYGVNSRDSVHGLNLATSAQGCEQ